MNFRFMNDHFIKAYDRIKDQIHHTPILTSDTLNQIFGVNLYFKCENLQKGGAFKIRGALNAVLNKKLNHDIKGIITHSSGNHAQAIAIVGKLLNLPTIVVMPKNAPKVKMNATKSYGAKVILCKPTQKDRENTVNEIIAKNGYEMIHPYDDDDIIFGAGSVGIELHQQIKDLDYILVPLGGGGLLSGIAMYTKTHNKNCKVIGVEPENADDALRSIRNKKRVTSHHPDTICDGLLTTLSERTYEKIINYVDDIVTVSDYDTIKAMQLVYERMKMVVEPSGIVGLAAINQHSIFKGKKVAIVISGGNVDMQNFFENYNFN